MFRKTQEEDDFFEKGKEFSERTTLFITIGAFFLVIILFIGIITLLLPKTRAEIKIVGPEKAKMGEWVTYTVRCKNTGNVILQNPELVLQYPTSSLPEKGLIEREKLGDFLYPKEEKILEFKARLFGQEGQRQEIKAWLDFSKKGKPVVLRETANFYTIISEVPIDLVIDVAPKIPIRPKMDSEFNFRIKYTSFIDLPISNLKIKTIFPFEFKLGESKPPPEEEKTWEIQPLSQGETEEIEFWGNFPAGTDIGKEFEFKSQLFAEINEETILLKEVSSRSVTFEPDFLFSQKINGKENYIANSGEKLHYQIFFQNIKNVPQRNLVLTVVLDGNLFDLFSVEAPLGEFHPGDNSISWEGEKVSLLRYITPGEKGQVEFWVRLKPDYKPKNVSETNALIKNRVLMSGFEKEFRYKVNTQLKILQEGYHVDKYGFFDNSGHHPPIVNETTTYTIVWKVENYYNLSKDTKVKATLPHQVEVKSHRSTIGELKILRELGKKPVYPEIPVDFRFEKPLYYGMVAEDVRYLQVILREEVPHLYPKNTGITGHFGKVTFEAVKGFQTKYRAEILFPQKLTEPTGYVDELTRAKLNELLAKGLPAGKTEVTWEIGKVDAGKGILDEHLVAAFQIAFTPELAQRGKVGTLVNEVTIFGTDQWTGSPLVGKDEPITTVLPDDHHFFGEGKIR